ncbi:MAG TPA: hypothetical protein PKH10_07535 [bacterium]|nr:hypothetical protein [bacterium]
MNPKEKIKELALSFSNISSEDENDTGPVGYLIGAMYCLQKAIDLGHKDGLLIEDDDNYRLELQEVAKKVAENNDPREVWGTRKRNDKMQGVWLAGCYFNMAMQKIDAVRERIGIEAKKNRDLELVYNDVNCLKHHDPQIDPTRKKKGLLPGRTATIDNVIGAIKFLREHFQRKGVLG